MIIKGGKQVQYWFTKTYELRGAHEGQIIDSILSPDSSTLATLSSDETLRFWRLFESFEEVDEWNKERTEKYLSKNTGQRKVVKSKLERCKT